MATVKIKADFSEVIKNYNKIYNAFTSTKGLGLGIRSATYLLVENIHDRLDVRTGVSGYQYELKRTMRQLDEDFVNRLSGNYYTEASSFGRSAWANRTEAERRVKGSGYKKGRITKSIKQAMKASEPIKIPDGMGVGIGRIETLNNLFTHLGVEDRFKLWQILNYGTGTMGAKGSPVVRTKKQVFYNRKVKKGVLAYTTTNPGFKGREFIVKMDGSMHKSDIAVRNQIFVYLREMLKLNPFAV